jgi:hypothetical protein
MIRLFLMIESLGFCAAALVHFGILIPGYEHTKARIAELVIAIVLLIGLVVTFISPTHLRLTTAVVQGFV